MELKPVKPQTLVKLLHKLGFAAVHQKGSHVRFRHPDGRATSVPLHPGEEIGRGLLRHIISEIKLSREEFLELLAEL